MPDIFNRLYDAIAALLAWLYALPGVGYGGSIILLTVVVMVVMMPLTLSATRSTLKMQHFQPELKRIQREYADDREEMNRQMMALYQEQGINPVGGCVPMLAQLPVFLVLFGVVRGITRRVSEEAFFEVTNAVRPAMGLAPLDGDQFDPRFVRPDTELYQDLVSETTMKFGPIDLAATARDQFTESFVGFLPYLVLILFVVAASYYQQRQVMARRSNAAAVNPQQQAIMRFMPLVTGFTSFIFPAALVVYFAVSGVFRIGQQGYITRRFYRNEGDDHVEAGPDGTDDGTPPSGSDGASASSAPDGGGGSGGKSSGKSGHDGPKKSTSKNSSDPTNAVSDEKPTSASEREQAWAKRRKEKQRRSQEKKSVQSRKQSSSGRVTPKGAKAPAKKRKR